MSVIIIFLQKAIAQGIGMLYGALGEIVTEKSGNLNLGVPGVMYMGGIVGLMGAFFYENGNPAPNGLVGLIISFLCAFLAGIIGGLIYSILTITLRANQNVTGLALTTFGTGFGNFFGGSLSACGRCRSDLRCLNWCSLYKVDPGAEPDPGDRTGAVFLRIYDIPLHYPGMCARVFPRKDEKRPESPRSR